MNGISILVSDHHGIYVPKMFANICKDDPAKWHLTEDAIKELLDGPDNENYWDAWDDVLTYAQYKDEDGYTWQLFQDGDLFAICTELMDSDTYYNFFGYEKEVG